MVKIIKTYTLCLLGVFFLMLVSCSIPQECIDFNLNKTAQNFSEKQDADFVKTPISELGQFNLADAIQYDIAGRMTSVYNIIKAPYNKADSQCKAINKANNIESYGRYWHGTPMILRFLLVFMTNQGVDILIKVLFILLTIALLFSLYKKLGIKIALIFMLSLLSINAWGFVINISNFSVYLLMCIGSLYLLWSKNRSDNIFIVLGCLTCIFDFLTCEILTLGIPFIIYYLLDENLKFKDLIRIVLYWGIAYCFTFLLKVFLLFIVVGNVENVISGIKNRTESFSLNIFTDMLNAVYFNIRRTTIMNKLDNLYSVLICFILFLGAVLVLCRKKLKQHKLLLIISILPFIRYIVLSNHSYYHAFFTYRDLMIYYIVLFYLVSQTMKKSIWGISFFKA